MPPVRQEVKQFSISVNLEVSRCMVIDEQLAGLLGSREAVQKTMWPDSKIPVQFTKNYFTYLFGWIFICTYFVEATNL